MEFGRRVLQDLTTARHTLEIDIMARLMPFTFASLRSSFADITWPIGTHNVALKKCAHFFKIAQTSGSSRTLKKIAPKFGLKSLNIEKEILVQRMMFS